jgi:hypothetical protein
MASKMVADRLKLRKIVVGAVTVNAPKVAQTLTEHLTPLLREGETLPDLQLVQELLLCQANQAMVRLRSDDVPTPESRSEGLETDLRQWPDRVEPKVRALEQVLQEIETERWFGFNTVSDKSGALSEFDFTVGNVTRIQRGLFALAGLFRAAELFFPQKMIQRIRNGSEESVPETSEPVEEESPPDPPSTETPAEPDPLL